MRGGWIDHDGTKEANQGPAAERGLASAETLQIAEENPCAGRPVAAGDVRLKNAKRLAVDNELAATTPSRSDKETKDSFRSTGLRPCDQVLRFVVLTNKLEQLFLRSQSQRQVFFVGLGERLWIFECHIELHVTVVNAPVAFGHVQCF